MDANPGEQSTLINGVYPEGRALSTVPLNILAALRRHSYRSIASGANG